MFFRSAGIGRVPFPVLVESLEPENGHIVRLGPGEQIVEVNLLVVLAGLLRKFGRRGGPTRFDHGEREAGQGLLDGGKILAGESHRLGQGFIFPDRVSVHPGEIDRTGQFLRVAHPRGVVLGGGDRLVERLAGLLQQTHQTADRHAMVVPINQRLVPDVHRGDHIRIGTRQLDGAADLLVIGRAVGRQFVRRHLLLDPRARPVGARFGVQPCPEHHFDRQLFCPDEFEDRTRVFPAVIKPQEAEARRFEQAQILQNFLPRRILRPLPAVRVLPPAEAGVTNGHHLPVDQCLRLLRKEIRRGGRARGQNQECRGKEHVRRRVRRGRGALPV